MMGLVDYDSESGSEQSGDETKQRSNKRVSAPEEDFFGNAEDVEQDNGDPTEAVPLFDNEEHDLDDVVKPKDWEKALAEKAKRKLEKKAEKRKRKQAKLDGETKEESTSPSKNAEIKPKKKAQIALFGALNMSTNVASDSEEEEDKPGPSTLAQPGAKGLLGMLPAPTKAAPKPGTKQGIMLPPSLRATATKKPAPVPATTTTITKKTIVPHEQESDSDDEPADFFGFASSGPSAKIAKLEDDPHVMDVPMIPTGGLDAVVGPMRPAENEYMHPSEMYNMAGVEMEQKQKGIISDAEAQRLIMEREGHFSGMGVSEIVNNIQEFSVSSALGPDIHTQLMRNLTKAQHAKASSIPIPKATSVRDVNAKRKHQITYLAQIAVAREEALQEARADSKHTKRMARQKYGF